MLFLPRSNQNNHALSHGEFFLENIVRNHQFAIMPRFLFIQMDNVILTMIIMIKKYEVKTDENITRILIQCADADKIERKSKEHSIVTENKISHAQKITLEHIDMANHEKLDDIGGLNESFESKLDHLALHEHLYNHYSSGKLGEKNLSHCLDSMKETRDRQLQQFRFGLGAEFSGFVKNPVRLAKIPAGYPTPADCSFASCAMYYLNLSAQIIPHFLAVT